jgi:outer membrane protein assembly factor BamE (lipoprotein component of BamABCDE complex)
MPRLLMRWAVGAVIFLIAGCAHIAVQALTPGTSASDVRGRLGAPNDERTIDGRKAWDYVQGPQGFTTWRVNFDGSDRVASVEQILTERRIQSLERGKHGKEDILALLGRPAATIQFSAMGEEVWTYRFLDVQERKLGDVHMDGKSGRVKFISTYPDPAYVNAPDF